MRVVCAPNAFKGTLSAARAAAAMARGVRDVDPGAEVVEVPVADGGDGTLDVILSAAGTAGTVTRHRVSGPLGARVRARIGWIGRTRVIIELAEVSGLRRLPGGILAPMSSSSRGVGELIAIAAERGAHHMVVGLGGSASSDGGAGLLQGLGARLLDAHGRELAPGGGSLVGLAHIDVGGIPQSIRDCTLELAVDVHNPLSGPAGSAHLFAPQKGATTDEVHRLEEGLVTLARVLEADLGLAPLLAQVPGTGAAGGAAYGLHAVLGARIAPGAGLVCDLVGLDSCIRGSDLVLTGEGRLDALTAGGKAPAEVARRAGIASIPCVVIAGRVDDAVIPDYHSTIELAMFATETIARRRPRRMIRLASQAAIREFLARDSR